ncbi:hypothetical protein [Streptomyces sp. CA-106110]|uniref:hypothetical protein n=1 Tax=Streptomyces sp. CA-106110 TaxID=3240044 RepID=UPI003D8CFA02
MKGTLKHDGWACWQDRTDHRLWPSGAAIAAGLAQAGAEVILLARAADELDEADNAIRATASGVEVCIVTRDPANQLTMAIDDLLSGARSMF